MSSLSVKDKYNDFIDPYGDRFTYTLFFLSLAINVYKHGNCNELLYKLVEMDTIWILRFELLTYLLIKSHSLIYGQYGCDIFFTKFNVSI